MQSLFNQSKKKPLATAKKDLDPCVMEETDQKVIISTHFPQYPVCYHAAFLLVGQELITKDTSSMLRVVNIIQVMLLAQGTTQTTVSQF